MRTLFLLSCLLLQSFGAVAIDIYSKAFGKKDAPAVIFLHGGPGYNCASFEFTTAQKLADQGFFVIVYDRRGEGRSEDPNALFTYEQTFKDLDGLYKKYKIEKATLIGHSFGGIVGTLYAQANMDKVNALVLVGAPVNLQESFKHIISTCKSIYTAKEDKMNLGYITMLEKMDSTSIEYSSYCFMHAMSNGFYSPKNPTAEAREVYTQMKGNEELKKWASAMTLPGPQGFWRNEQYTTISLAHYLMALQNMGLPIYGFYGKEDGLYSAQQIAALTTIIGEPNMFYYDDCSHSVFIDQQSAFLRQFKEKIK